MPSLSYEKLLQNVLSNPLLKTRFDQLAVIDSFLKPFSLPDPLHEKILADFDTWHYPYVNNVGSVFPEHPPNCRLADQYTIHTFSIPDRLHSFTF